MMEKIRGFVGINDQLQNNGVALVRYLSDEHTFLDPDLDNVWSPINLSYTYFLISLHNSFI